MDLRIALAGNPNSGKTTLFNALTGSNQFVGNWPGVTVEKKEGKLKKHDGVIITDLPGIYSLSPYTLEEVVARNYLIGERPDAILNIVDGTNLERNLYLTTQLTELGIPVVIAINMADVIAKNGDKINIPELSRELGCKVVEISALKGSGIAEAAEAAIDAAKNTKTVPMHTFSGAVEHALAHIEEAALHNMPQEQQRWYAIKIFERDDKVLSHLDLDKGVLSHIEEDIKSAETECDDDAESVITNERYLYIASLMKGCYKKKSAGKLSTSDKIDKVVTNRFAALPIFAVIMFLVYYISVTTVGTIATDWANDGVFGDGWHLFGIGTSAYEDDMNAYAEKNVWTNDLKTTVNEAVSANVIGADDIQGAMEDGDYGAFDEAYGSYADSMAEGGYDISGMVDEALENENVPDTSTYGIWIPGIPVFVENGLNAVNCAGWLKSLLLDGIVGGVGAVLGFVPQMLVLFILLGFLEACGYMARIAFVLDRVFRKFGLSGKSFIPMLIGTGCGVPGIMASRTIENERDRRMTIMTTTFIPCGAKLPIIALIASALFGGAWWVAPSAYFIGIAAIVSSGIMLKKTTMFAGDPAPFVMELPAYHWPTVGNVLRSMWERASSFIRKAGTIILLSSIIIWAGSCFGFVDGAFTFSTEMELESSVLGIIGGAISWLFVPAGFGNIKATVATIMGLVAKEEVVGVFGVLDFEGMTQLAAYSFLIFNLLCAPCFAAMGAIKREMNSAKWTSFAIGYQCVFAYAVSLMVFQIGSAFSGQINPVGLIAALLVLAFMIYMLAKPYKEATTLAQKVTVQ
ncbi:MAG: ferrous iron transporter B [Oscillospiraceae bacterium]|jgi:ferrous iron transport protein B|nr:ferrous iron transporter B [Oscillospiraceae bacterium]